MDHMLVRRMSSALGAVVLMVMAAVQTAVGLPSAAAQPCPDVEVIFARGTGAPPGLGWLGNAFVDSLRAKMGGRSVGAYGVNYPASFDFDASAPMGARDAAGRVQWMADNCPGTKLVLGGNSQGAGVIDLITVDPRPLGRFTPTPLPAHLADRVAAVAVFGNPLRNIDGGGPLPQMSGVYGPRTIDLCGLDDPFCSSGLNFPAHFSYIKNGMVEEAANFVAGRLR
ncbi:cutinase [Mycolicibacterium iranicum]|uniref:Cutinase n=2 Tax=Mycolicibacterium iranicum TaxID=912594 RepID=A0A839QAP9_MYCIR|nr:cutinase [Mycolicibacterium iranicum]